MSFDLEFISRNGKPSPTMNDLMKWAETQPNIILDGNWALADRAQILWGAALFRKAVAIFREFVKVARCGARNGSGAKSGEAMTNVRRVADFAHFAIAHDINPGFGLFAHNFGNRALHRRVENGGINSVSSVLCKELINHLLRAWQTADVCG